MMTSNIALEPLPNATALTNRFRPKEVNESLYMFNDIRRNVARSGAAVNDIPGPSSYLAAGRIHPNFWTHTPTPTNTTFDPTMIQPRPPTMPHHNLHTHRLDLHPPVLLRPLTQEYEAGAIFPKQPREERKVILNTIPKVVTLEE